MEKLQPTRFIRVDKARLYYAIEKRNLTASVVSKEIGFNDSYISNCATRGTMSAPAAKLLEQLYNIKPDEYEATPGPAGAKEEASTSIPLNWKDDLYNVIYNAVYQAVKKAWENE